MLNCRLANITGQGTPMRNPAIPLAVLLVLAAGQVACDRTEEPPPQPPKVSFAEDVQPILQAHCLECHVAGGQGAEASGLLLDSYEALMKGTSFGPVIHPGSAKTSSLYILITGKDRLTITMPHGREPLDAGEIETLRLWIDSGALEN
jgi:hypothetical protein